MAELNFISDSNTDRVPNDIAQKINENIGQLKRAALNFLHQIDEITTVWYNTERLANLGKIDLSAIKKAMQSKDEIARKLISQQYIFQSVLNKFLDRKIYLAWVDLESGEIYFGTEEEERIFYQQTAKKKADGRASIKSKEMETKFKKASEFNNFNENSKLNKLFQKTIEMRQKHYNEIFTLVMSRWMANHDKAQAMKGTHYYYYNKYRNQIWWNENEMYDPLWSWSKKVNRGNISQAYVSLIMGNDKDDDDMEFSKNPGEEDVKKYWSYMQHHHILNNKPGIAGGDVTMKLLQDNNISIQFSVKAGEQFNTAGIIPYIKTAYIILSLDDQKLTKEQLEKVLKNISSYYKKLDKSAMKKAEKAVEETINKAAILN